jgi:hypothetical protein
MAAEIRPQSARNRVLQSPELLEAIILQLPLRDIIFKAQLVSSFFCDTICESPLLQQALFLGRAPCDRTILSTPNPLLAHTKNARFLDHRFWNGEKVGCNASWTDSSGFRQLDWDEFKVRRKKYQIKGASWKNMLIVNPPIQELLLVGGTTLRNDDGITLGQLAYALVNWNMFVIYKDGCGKLLKVGQDADLFLDMRTLEMTNNGVLFANYS